MEFSEFASLLHPIIGEGSSTHDFAHTLFDTIITEENSDILESYSTSTFKAYFNGKTSIRRIAQKILPFIEPEQFESYLDSFLDATTANLCTAFNEALPEIDLYNASEKITALFVSIIMDCASTKKKGYSPKDEQQKKEFNEKSKMKLTETDSTEHIEPEVADGDKQSDTVDNNTAIIQQQTNVIQNGENNFNLTNNGTMNFNL